MEEYEVGKAAPLDDDLEYTRKLKYQILEKSFDEKGVMVNNDDPKQRDFVLRLMDSMDKTAIARKRIQVDEGANEIARETNGFLSQLHSHSKPDPFRTSNPVERNMTPDLGKIDISELNPHMLTQVLDSGKTNFDEFNKDFLELHPEYDD